MKLWIAVAKHNFKWLKILISWLSALRVNLYYESTKLVLGMNYVSKYQDLQIFVLKLKKRSNFQPLEVVGRGSQTQLQVGEKLNKLT